MVAVNSAHNDSADQSLAPRVYATPMAEETDVAMLPMDSSWPVALQQQWQAVQHAYLAYVSLAESGMVSGGRADLVSPGPIHLESSRSLR